MKLLLKLFNLIQFLDMFLFVPYLLFGEKILLFEGYSETGKQMDLPANQSIIFIGITLVFIIYARVKEIVLYEDLSKMLSYSNKAFTVIVFISLIICIIFEALFLNNKIPNKNIVVSVINAVFVVFCNSIANR